MSDEQSIDIVFLETTLFGGAKELLEATESIDGITTEHIKLQPEIMSNVEWDGVLHRILQAGKVVTL